MAPARSLQKMNSKMAELSKDISEFTEDKQATIKRNEVTKHLSGYVMREGWTVRRPSRIRGSVLVRLVCCLTRMWLPIQLSGRKWNGSPDPLRTFVLRRQEQRGRSLSRQSRQCSRCLIQSSFPSTRTSSIVTINCKKTTINLKQRLICARRQ